MHGYTCAMDTYEAVYYVCLNRNCERHRNIFLEGDPQHEGCARERLHLQGERTTSPWLWLALAAGVAGVSAAAVFLLLRNVRSSAPKTPPLHDGAPTKTWSGAHAHRDDRMSHRVPPPLFSANE